MSGSHFGSGYFPDDYFGLYFQPDSGGVIVGALSGSFAGSASFAGTLAAPSLLKGRLRGRRRWLSSAALAEREKDLEALRKRTVEAVGRKEIVFGSGVLGLLERNINADADRLGLVQPFEAESFDRLQKLIELTQQIDAALMLIQAREDEEDEEILLLAA